MMPKYYSGDHIKEEEKWELCDIVGRGQGFLWVDLKEWDHVEDLGADGRMILKWILKK
jgi:hypothetical protein